MSEEMTHWGAEVTDHIIVLSERPTLTLGTFVTPDHLCPDLLRYEQIGEADNWRGRAVRTFFWLMRAWRT